MNTDMDVFEKHLIKNEEHIDGVDSSITKLQCAIELLTDGLTHNRDCGLDYAAAQAESISEALSEVNGSLASGWTGVSDFCLKIHNMTLSVFSELNDEIHEFIFETASGEKAATAATEAANQAAADILSDLGLDINN